MATIAQIKTTNNTNIRTKTLPGSITKTNDADMRDAVADELRDRGALKVETTGALAGVSKDNTNLVLVRDVGFFLPLNTGSAANGETTFASATSGWLWEKWIDTSAQDGMTRFTDTGDTSHVLSDVLTDLIMFRLENSDTIRIGTTNGGEEIMPDEPITAGQWFAIGVLIVASGSSQTIYINGASGSIEVMVYKRKLPVLT